MVTDTVAGWAFTRPHTLPASDADCPDWHRGRPRYAVWLLPITEPAILQRQAQLQALLADVLWPQPQRQAHITLRIAGFTVPQAHWPDDFTPAQQQQQQQALATLRPPAFTLYVGGPDSFDSAAFLRVSDPGAALEPLRQALALPQSAGEFRDGPYRPHLTVGLYRHALSTRTLAQRLRPLAELPPLPLPVDELHLADYDARCFNGPLRLLYRHHLPRA